MDQRPAKNRQELDGYLSHASSEDEAAISRANAIYQHNIHSYQQWAERNEVSQTMVQSERGRFSFQQSAGRKSDLFLRAIKGVIHVGANIGEERKQYAVQLLQAA